MSESILSKLLEKGLKSGKELPFIYQEDYLSAIKKVLSFCAPYCKVGLVCYADSAKDFLSPITTAIRSVGAEAVSFVAERKFNDDLACFSDFFNMPEDVRALIIVDVELFDKAAYFCSVKNLPLIFAPKDAMGVCGVKDTILIKNGGLNKFRITCEKHLIIDKNLYESGYSALYGHIMSKLVTLTDYRAIGSLNGYATNEKGYSLLRKAVVSLFALTEEQLKKDTDEIIVCGIMAEAGLNLLGDIRFESSESAAAYLMKKDLPLGKRELFSSLAILSVYKIYTDSKQPMLNFTDYNKREKELLRITDFEKGVTLKNLSRQSDLIHKNRVRLKATFNIFKSEIAGFNKIKGSVLKKYISLGGDKTRVEGLAFAVKFCGDLFENVNCMSFLREEGFLEDSYE